MSGQETESEAGEADPRTDPLVQALAWRTQREPEEASQADLDREMEAGA